MNRHILFCLIVIVHLTLPVSILGEDLGTLEQPRGLAIVWDYLLGGTLDGKWAPADTLASYVLDGQTYQFYSFDQKLCTGMGSGAEPLEDPGGFGVEMRGRPLPAGTPEGQILPQGELGISGTWNALPRKPNVQTGGLEPYGKEVAAILKKNGLGKAPVKITRVVRCDLDGDKQDEVLIVAQTVKAIPEFKKNTYALVLFRRLIKGTVQTAIIRKQFIKENKSGEADGPSEYDVPFILDANGDEIMEVFLTGRYYEGIWMEIHELQGDTLKMVLSEGLGA